MREGIYRGEPLPALRARARAAGRYTTLFEDGVRKVLEGKLTVDELLRVTRAEEATAAAAAEGAA